MNVDIEFFSDDPMDNVLSCLKFDFPKVIFLGYAEEDMDRAAKSTVAAFLKSEKIGVKSLEFIALPEGKLDKIEAALIDIVQRETAAGNQCYFDLTGGEELALAAAGVVSDELDVPMHEIDLLEDEVRIQARPELYTDLTKRDYRLNIEEYLNLHEGVVEVHMLKKKNKNHRSPERKARIQLLYKVANEMGKKWNRICLALAKLCSGQGETIYAVEKELKAAARVIHEPVEVFWDNLEQLQQKGVLKRCVWEGAMATVEFYDGQDREILCDPGAVLEHMTYWQVMEDPEVNDCVIGYHINWVGEGDPMSVYEPGPDVVNEVDVIYMRKNIPTFISCKNKLVEGNHPLYELETVADRFGGTLVRKVLVVKGGITKGTAERAQEMDIIVTDTL